MARPTHGACALLGLLSLGIFTCVTPARAQTHGDTPAREAVSFGGQHRLLYRYAKPMALGLLGRADDESVLLIRTLLHLEGAVLPSLRLFAQVGSYQALGIEGSAAPPDADDGDLAQLFVEVAQTFATRRLGLRVGRQELPLGSTRWFSARDGANMRLALDLARVTLEDERLTLDAFAGFEQRYGRRAFDNRPDGQQRLWGTYNKLVLISDDWLSGEAFYLGRQRASVQYGELSGRETRHTLSLRLFGKTPFGLEYIQHALVQLGRLDGASVRAWGLSGAVWQHLSKPNARWRFGTRWDVLSGDRRAGDGRLSTFDPLFPNPTFLSALPLLHPSNLYEVHPLLSLSAGAVSMEAGCTFFWRESVRDAVYGVGGGAILIDGKSTRARYTGTQLALLLSHQIDERFSVEVSYSYVFAGAAVRAAGGDDMTFFSTATTLAY